MLTLSTEVINKIMQDCQNACNEQGWLIGCVSQTDHIEVCRQLSSVHATRFCYPLDSMAASEAIRNWAKNDICAIGFIHSHLVGEEVLSRADRESAETLIRNLKLPFLYIGIVVNKDDTKLDELRPLFMYQISTNRKQGYTIKPIQYSIENHEF